MLQCLLRRYYGVTPTGRCGNVELLHRRFTRRQVNPHSRVHARQRRVRRLVLREQHPRPRQRRLALRLLGLGQCQRTLRLIEVGSRQVAGGETVRHIIAQAAGGNETLAGQLQIRAVP